MRKYLFAAVLLLLNSGVQAIACETPYVTRKGDTLGGIAERYYGSIFHHDLIRKANLDLIGEDPTNLSPNQVLTLPCGGSAEAPLNFSVLIYPKQLFALKQVADPQILDIRDPRQYTAGFIPEASLIPYTDFRGSEENPGRPASNEALSTVIGEAGLRLDQPIVIIHSKGGPFDSGRGAYVYWVLKSLGARQVALMSGGFKAWELEGYPVAEEARSLPAYRADLTLASTWWSDRREIEGVVSGKMSGTLLDARPSSIFLKRNGSGSPLATTLPNAQNAPATQAFRTLSSAGNDEMALLSSLKGQEVDWQADRVISFCDTGELAALNWFYASELTGIENVKLYPESTRGWLHGGNELAPAPLKEIFDDLFIKD